MKVSQAMMCIAAVGLVACASTPPPHDRQASSEAAIRAAKEIGAAQVPQAALHLKFAQEWLDKAKAQMREGDNAEASYTLLRAQADAELALALARENKTSTDAQAILERVRALRAEHSGAAVQPKPAVGGGPQ